MAGSLSRPRITAGKVSRWPSTTTVTGLRCTALRVAPRDDVLAAVGLTWKDPCYYRSPHEDGREAAGPRERRKREAEERKASQLRVWNMDSAVHRQRLYPPEDQEYDIGVLLRLLRPSSCLTTAARRRGTRCCSSTWSAWKPASYFCLRHRMLPEVAKERTWTIKTPTFELGIYHEKEQAARSRFHKHTWILSLRHF